MLFNTYSNQHLCLPCSIITRVIKISVHSNKINLCSYWHWGINITAPLCIFPSWSLSGCRLLFQPLYGPVSFPQTSQHFTGPGWHFLLFSNIRDIIWNFWTWKCLFHVTEKVKMTPRHRKTIKLLDQFC